MLLTSGNESTARCNMHQIPSTATPSTAQAVSNLCFSAKVIMRSIIGPARKSMPVAQLGLQHQAPLSSHPIALRQAGHHVAELLGLVADLDRALLVTVRGVNIDKLFPIALLNRGFGAGKQHLGLPFDIDFSKHVRLEAPIGIGQFGAK